VHSSLNGPEKNLHLFIVSKQDDKNILYGITNMLMKLSLKDDKALKESILLISGIPFPPDISNKNSRQSLERNLRLL
jgi:hypothetical protein